MRKYSVYVIELASAVKKSKRFRMENPLQSPLKPCLYVGSTYKSPDERFDQHKQGYKANRFARKYGLKLRPDLFESYNPIPTRKDAEEIERYLADRLRKKGYGVWQG